MQVEPLDILGVPLSGVTLIEASAGTGKTYTLAALYVRLLLEQELSVDQILVVTYTRAATAELRMRIRSRIGETLDALANAKHTDDAVLNAMMERAAAANSSERWCSLLTQALAELDRAAIFTIHGFCQRVLQRYPFESGAAFDAELSEDQNLLLSEVVSDFWASKLATADEAFALALKKHHVTIESLLRFVQRALPNPDLRLVPEQRERVDTGALLPAYELARSHAARLWAADRERLIDMLLRSGLNKNSFGEKKVRGEYAPSLDRLNTYSALELPEFLEKLTPAGLASACNKDGCAPKHWFFNACQQLCEAAQQLRAAESNNIRVFMRELLDYARAELQHRAEARGLMTFEDLLMRVHQALHSPRGPRLQEVLRASYRAALIDEFQDTDPVQLEVFRSIYAPAHADPRPALFLIGDPKQAIYAFRGADIFAYLAAARKTIDRAATLTTSYRSDPKLLSAIARIFGSAAKPFVFDEIGFRDVQHRPGAQAAMEGPALEFLFLERAAQAKPAPLSKPDVEAALPGRIATEIATLLCSEAKLNGRAVQPGQIAVLCRTNAQAGAVQNALRLLGIPAVLDGDASVFDSAMAEELGRWLWAMAEPGDSARIRAALATAGIGLSADDLLELEREEARWDAWVSSFHRYQSTWQTRGFLSALHALCDEHNVTERLLRLPDGERRYTDMWHLAELLHGQEQQTHHGPRGLLDFYRRVREGSAQREGMALEDVQVRLESDAHAVTLTTIHKSKGLEYPIVYCPYLWAGAGLWSDDKAMPLYHDRAQQDVATLTLPGDRALLDRGRGCAELEALAEGTRLLYVALTRAKHRLYVVWGAVRGFEESALAFVLHQGPICSDADAMRQQLKKHLAKCFDADLRHVLQQLSAAEPDALSVRPLLPAADEPRYEPQRKRGEDLAARQARFPTRPQARVGSFSALVERDHKRARHAPGAEPEPLDRDAEARAVEPEPEPAGAPAPPAARVALAELPAGASFGHLIHGIYERADFGVQTARELSELVDVCVSEFGGDSSWEPVLSSAIFDSLGVQLSAAGGELPCLAAVPRGKRLNELEFVFPVADASHADAAALSPRRLGQLIAAHARDADERAYAQQLGRLRFSPLRGFLRGFIDLAVEHEGRFYVIDYKSNRLGDSAADYQRPRMLDEMRRHHYVLQYLLYSVALHRYLSLRLPGYSYEQHFGGVYYLFVRGMSATHPPGSGVLFERPARALIEELSACLRSPELRL